MAGRVGLVRKRNTLPWPTADGKAKGNPSAGQIHPVVEKALRGGEKRVSTPCRPPANSTQPSSPTAHSGLHSLQRTIIGSKTTILNLPPVAGKCSIRLNSLLPVVRGSLEECGPKIEVKKEINLLLN